MKDAYILFIIGGVLLLLSVIVYLWHRSEVNRYYAAITGRYDVREFIERKPVRPEPQSLLIGAIVLAVVSVILFVFGFINL